MVTFAQAQERAEEWVNGDLPGYQHREVRVREFELGFVAWMALHSFELLERQDFETRAGRDSILSFAFRKV